MRLTLVFLSLGLGLIHAATPARNSGPSVLTDSILLWDTRTIPYSLEGITDASVVTSVLAAMREIESQSCVKFQAQQGQEDSLRIVFDAAGCQSSVGRQGGRQVLRLAPGCRQKGEIMHELMHVLGLWHEHSRVDRDAHVTVWRNNIQPEHWKDYDVRVMATEVLQLPYDLQSILHYRGTEFAVHPDQPTLTSKQRSLLGQRDHLTDGDRSKLSALYHCSVSRCPEPESVGDALRWNPSTEIGAVVLYSCPEGKRLYGVTKRQCLTNGKWSGRAPLCVANTLAICTFEEGGFCGWNEPVPPLLRWLHHSGTRISQNTGPDYDHTAMDHTGHYLYLQVIPESEEGFSATLISPTFHYAGQDVCLLLHYHMFSTDDGMGTLQVSAFNSATSQVIFERSGNHGNIWLKQTVLIPYKTDFKVKIEAIQEPCISEPAPQLAQGGNSSEEGGSSEAQLVEELPEESREPVFVDGRLICVNLGYAELPDFVLQDYAASAVVLDLSHNSLTSLEKLEAFRAAEELVLDDNLIDDLTTFPQLPHVHTLMLNKNKIQSLPELLQKLVVSFEKLEYLSLLGNEVCPIEGDDDDHRRYRIYVASKLSKLRFLDFSPVSDSERVEAARLGGFIEPVRMREDQDEQQDSNELSNSPQGYTPLPTDMTSEKDRRSAFGYSRYKYFGKHSEGNRFILNKDL